MSLSLESLHAQTTSLATFDRYVIPRPRSTPPLHYWADIDDQDNGVVVLIPKSPAANGYGVITVDSAGFVSHKDSFWDGDNLNQWQWLLQRGYTVFIITHPPSSFLQGGGVLPQPGYVSSEIREFVELSVIEIKKFNQGVPPPNHPAGVPFPIVDPSDPNSYGGFGGSAGAFFILDIAMKEASLRKSTLVTDLNGVETLLDSGVGATAVCCPGVDTYNWRFPGDDSYMRRNASGFAHVDLSASGFPVPSYLGLPTHYPPAQQIQFPANGGLLTDALNGVPSAQFLPEGYLKKIPSATGGDVLWKHVLFDTLSFTVLYPAAFPFPPPADRAVNNNDMALNTIYQVIPTDWAQMFTGHNIVDLVHSAAPPVFYLYGDTDSVVVPFQAERFKTVYDGRATASNLSQFPRFGQRHGWRDMDQKDFEAFADFFDLHIRGIVDSDKDGLPDSQEAAFSVSEWDTDGDGQGDRNEYEHENLTGTPVAGSSDLDNPFKTFRITSIKKKLNMGLKNWRITITFQGGGGNAASDYEVQTSISLFSEGPPVQFYPQWKTVLQNYTITPTGTPDEFEFTLNRPVNAGSDEKFYRVVFKGGSAMAAFRTISTAPVGLDRMLISRNDPLASTVPRANLICYPFQTPDLWRVRVNTATQASAQTIWTSANTTAYPVSVTTNPNTPIYPTEAGSFEYYAMISEDWDTSSRRPGRITLPLSPTNQSPNPEDHGLEGHWWFLDAAAGSTMTLDDWPSNDTLATAISPGSSVSVRRLASLADLFDGLQDTRPSAGANRWLRAADITSSPSTVNVPSPFRAGDQIRFLKRCAHSIAWDGSMSFTPSEVEAWTILEFYDGGIYNGYWFESTDSNTPPLPVDLDSFHMRPDEAIEYLATPLSSDKDDQYWSSGLVPTSDIVAYVNALATPTGCPSIPSQQVFPPAADSGTVYYGVSAIGWPFPVSSKIVTRDKQDSMFFASGLTMDPDLGTSINGMNNVDLPPTSLAGAVLFYTDYTAIDYVGDSAQTATAVWGQDTGLYAYWDVPLPLVRSAYISSAGRVFGNNLGLGSQGGTVGEPLQTFRSGRGYNILMNRASATEKLVQEWRMRRPYRRP